jgi:hypothetical protein
MSLKSSMRKANRYNARWVLINFADCWVLRHMRSGDQVRIPKRTNTEETK